MNEATKRIFNTELFQLQIDSKDVSNRTFIESSGFIRLGNLDQLLRGPVPKNDALFSTGLYAIVTSPGYIPNFIEPERARSNNNVIRPWNLERLLKKWVDDSDIVYYGIAGAKSERTLNKRISDLIRHGNGKTTRNGPHRGGEILWQLEKIQNFELWILAYPNPRELEEALLIRFYQLKGKLPFANRTF